MSEGSETDLARELRQLANAAAPGPWHVGSADDAAYMSAEFVSTQQVSGGAWPPERSVVAITQLQLPRYAGNEMSEDNARFIAAARSSVPRLCDALERILGERAALIRSLRQLLEAAEMGGGTKSLGDAIERGHRLLGQLGER